MEMKKRKCNEQDIEKSEEQNKEIQTEEMIEKNRIIMKKKEYREEVKNL